MRYERGVFTLRHGSAWFDASFKPILDLECSQLVPGVDSIPLPRRLASDSTTPLRFCNLFYQSLCIGMDLLDSVVGSKGQLRICTIKKLYFIGTDPLPSSLSFSSSLLSFVYSCA